MQKTFANISQNFFLLICPYPSEMPRIFYEREPPSSSKDKPRSSSENQGALDYICRRPREKERERERENVEIELDSKLPRKSDPLRKCQSPIFLVIPQRLVGFIIKKGFITHRKVHRIIYAVCNYCSPTETLGIPPVVHAW